MFLDTAPQFRTLFPSAARKKKKKTNEEKRKIERGRRKNKEERQSEIGFFGPNKQKRYLSENMKIIGFYTDKNSLGKPPNFFLSGQPLTPSPFLMDSPLKTIFFAASLTQNMYLFTKILQEARAEDTTKMKSEEDEQKEESTRLRFEERRVEEELKKRFDDEEVRDEERRRDREMERAEGREAEKREKREVKHWREGKLLTRRDTIEPAKLKVST